MGTRRNECCLFRCVGVYAHRLSQINHFTRCKGTAALVSRRQSTLWSCEPYQRLLYIFLLTVVPIVGPSDIPFQEQGGTDSQSRALHLRGRALVILSSCNLISCSFYSIDSKYRGHALKIASEIQLDAYDAVVAVSGDGTLHELVNGFAQHKEPIRALRMPIAVIPAGSGNAMSLNLMGANVRVPSSSSPEVTHLFFRTAWTSLLLR